MDPTRILLLYAESNENRTLSYQRGWPRAFAKHPGFDCTPLNVIAPGRFARVRDGLAALVKRHDAIVILHSVFSNQCNLGGWLYRAIRASRLSKAYFIGNEYKLMPQKMHFSEDLGIDLLVTQSESPPVHALYKQRLGCDIVGIPYTGLDVETFRPEVPWAQRPIDIGYRSADAPWYLGHDERRTLSEGVTRRAPAHDLKVDVSLADADRFDTAGWARFLNTTKAQLGSEAGGDCFELDDVTRLAVNKFLSENPAATFETVRDRFFSDKTPRTSLRVIAGRNIEAAGTKTVQILFEGEYSGYLQPDVHYIPLKKDFSNWEEVVAKLKDERHCRKLVDNAYELATTKLTYERLMARFDRALTPILGGRT